MRSRFSEVVVAVAFTTVASATGCANYGSNGVGIEASSNGGSAGAGGTNGSGGITPMANTGACTSVAPCGGDAVGTWNVTSSCLNVAGDLNVSLIGMACSSVPISGSLQVSGTWIADTNGTYTDNTTTTGTETFTLNAACLVISSTPVDCRGAANIMTALGYASATCTSNANGGCDCSAKVDQRGGVGLMSPLASSNGSYTTSNNALTTDDTLKYSYCVSGNTLTLIPQNTSTTATGIVVLQKNGTSGAGGASSTGGQPGSGGAPPTGLRHATLPST